MPVRSLFCKAAAIALMASAMAPSLAAEPLSLAEAQQLAVARSRQLVAHDAASTAAQEMAVGAGQLPDPVLRLGINNLPVTGPDRFALTRDFMTMRSVGLMQEFTREGKRKARAARFEREAEVAQAARSLALSALQRDTALAWLERYFLERIRTLLASHRDEARLQIDAADTAYRSNRGAQADVFAAHSALAQVEDRLAQVERQIETAKAQLARWSGADGHRALGPPPALDSVRLRLQGLETQLAQHPQTVLMVSKEAVARAEADAAQAAKQSDVSVELMFSQRGPAFSNMVSVNVSIPWQWDQKNRQDRELGARLAVLDQMAAEREEASRAQVAEAHAMLQEWQGNRDRLARHDSVLLPLAQERTRATIAAYRAGAATLASVFEARRAEIDTRLERLRLEMDTARLWAQLDYLAATGHGSVTPPSITR